MLILLGIAIVSATLWHWFVPAFIFAVLGATLTTMLSFQVAAYLQLGFLDPFFLIALVTSGAIALLVSVLIGLLFRWWRKQPHQL